MSKWVLVPEEATLAMLDAGWGICGTTLSSAQPNEDKIYKAHAGYKAMLAAAPSPPATDGMSERDKKIQTVVEAAKALSVCHEATDIREEIEAVSKAVRDLES